MSRIGTLVDNRHRQIITRLCSFTALEWIDERRLKGLYRESVRLRSTSAAIRVEKSTDRRGACVESDWSPSPATEGSMKKRGEGKKRGGSSQGELGDNRSGREVCREPDTETVFARMSRSSDSDSPRAKGAG